MPPYSPHYAVRIADSDSERSAQSHPHIGSRSPPLPQSRFRPNQPRSSSVSSASDSSSRAFALAPPVLQPLISSVEEDDHLHDPQMAEKGHHGISGAGMLNIVTLMILALALLMLFVGYPILSGIGILGERSLGRGLNGTGQVPDFPLMSLIDADTPANKQTWTNPDGKKYELVFSDEFNVNGRTFNEGDDPFWTAVDIWYGATFDYEWYDPGQIVTENHALKITFEEADPENNHNLFFKSGMLQSWNKTCLQGGYLEFSLMLPGSSKVAGWWPGAWTQGNLGRSGYLGTTEGMWPYSGYSACDTGILPHQTSIDGTGPEGAIDSKAPYTYNGQLSSLPGMRASSCTCPGEPHPGPNRNVARSAPEIDALEARIQFSDGGSFGQASQSWQVAPFDDSYKAQQSAMTIYNQDITEFNSYRGGMTQESVSAVTQIPDDAYELSASPRYVDFGFEWQPSVPGKTVGFVRWFMDGKPTWMVTDEAVPARPDMDIGQRFVSNEPMAMILNLAMAGGFQNPDFANIKFPAHLRVNHVRAYQIDGKKNPKISCDPPDHPTAAYINQFQDLYTNPNITTYSSRYGWPKNAKADGC